MIGSNFEWEDNDKNKSCSECGRAGLERILVSRDTYGRVRKIVCQETCRQEFDYRYWSDVVERKRSMDENKRLKSEYTRGFKDAMECYAGCGGEYKNLEDNPYYRP